MLSDNFRLRPALLDDVPFCAEAICEVSSGILDEILEPLKENLGFESAAELLEAVLYESFSATLSLSNMLVLEAEGVPHGLLFAYVPRDGELILPEFAAPLIDREELKLLDELSGAGLLKLLDLCKLSGRKCSTKLLYVNTLYVTQELRGQGIGKLLIAAALEQAAESGMDGIFLHCESGNQRALAFYAALGFVPLGTLAYPRKFAERTPQGGIILGLKCAEEKAAEQSGAADSGALLSGCRGGEHAD